MNASSNKVAFEPKRNEHRTLTNLIVAKAIGRQKEYFLRDRELKGFFVRVKPSGVKTFGVQGRLRRAGSTKQRTIGPTTRYTVKKAREIARDWLTQLADGKDPKRANKGQQTLPNLLEDYLNTKTRADRTVENYRYNFKHYLKNLRNRAIKDITVDDIVQWYAAGKSHPIGTDRTFTTVKTVLGFALALGFIESNPADRASTQIERRSSRKSQENLVALYKDLPLFMSAFVNTDISQVMRDWLVLALTTGLRKRESMTIRWDQVDLENKLVSIPQNKSNRFLLIPMIGLTYDMFQSRRMAPDRDDVYVFTSQPAKPIDDARKALKKICDSAGIKPISHHDLRRLFASTCHELNVSEDQIRRLLNHSSRSVTDLYISRSMQNARDIYQQVVDFLDRLVPFEATDDEKDEFHLTSTNLMRSLFFSKVEPLPDPPVSKFELNAKAIREKEYWVG